MLALQAVSLEPGNVNYFLTVGSILLKTNRADDAVRVAKRALSMAKTMQESATVGSFLRTAQQYQEYLAAQKQTEERVRAARSEHSDESA